MFECLRLFSSLGLESIHGLFFVCDAPLFPSLSVIVLACGSAIMYSSSRFLRPVSQQTHLVRVLRP